MVGGSRAFLCYLVCAMSVSVFWKPVTKQREYLNGQSSLVEALEVTFGELPITLTAEHVEVLRGMSVVAGRDDDNPYRALMDAIDKHDAVTVEKEF